MPGTGQSGCQIAEDLHLAGAHHQYRSLGQGVRVAVGRGVQLGQVGGQGVGAGRHLGLVVHADRHDHPVGAQLAPVGATR